MIWNLSIEPKWVVTYAVYQLTAWQVQAVFWVGVCVGACLIMALVAYSLEAKGEYKQSGMAPGKIDAGYLGNGFHGELPDLDIERAVVWFETLGG